MKLSESVDLANMALGHLGAKNIRILNDASQEAIWARTFLRPAVEQTLEAYDWGFARRYTLAAQLIDVVPRPGWANAYAFPNDAAAIRGLARHWPGEPVAKFEIGSNAEGARVVYTDHVGPYIVYTARDAEETTATPMFISAAARRLAFLMAFPLTKNRDYQKDQLAMFNSELVLAGASALNQGDREPEAAEYAPDWIDARS